MDRIQFALVLASMLAHLAWTLGRTPGREGPGGLARLSSLLPSVWLVRELYAMSLGRWLELKRERRDGIRDLKCAIEHLQAAIGVGLPLRIAVERLGKERIRSKMFRACFMRISGDLAMGRSLREILVHEGGSFLGGSSVERDLGVLLSSLALCEELGANTGALLSSLKVRLLEKEELARSLAIGTAQVRFQAVVLCSAPLIFALGYVTLSPSKLEFFTTSASGVTVLLVSMGLNLLGALFTWRMLKRWS